MSVLFFFLFWGKGVGGKGNNGGIWIGFKWEWYEKFFLKFSIKGVMMIYERNEEKFVIGVEEKISLWYSLRKSCFIFLFFFFNLFILRLVLNVV